METTTPFTEFELNSALLNSLQTIGFENASPIQELTIGPILEGKDIFAQAETGSGKTGSFAIPIIEQILREEGTEGPQSGEDKLVQYIVMSPTRELAQQTHKVFDQLGKDFGVHATCLIGGESIDKQKSLLKEGTRVLIATPGRLVDLVKQKSVSLTQVKSVVFDEADRLFDMGFQKDIEFILGKVPTDRQLIMVSATSNLEVLKTAYKFKSHPLELKLNEDSLVVDNIDHSLAMITQKEKMPFLVNTLRSHEDVYAIIFCNTQLQTHLVAEWLRMMDFKAKPISGRLPQNKRTKLMEEFRAKEVTILVCTDVAARGLDIKDVNLVINYDLPQEAASYVHRIGRTGRAGKEGKAISFCAHEDCEHLDDIYKFIDSKIEKMDIKDEDVKADIPSKPYIDGKTMKPVSRNERNNDRGNKRDTRRDGRKDRDNKKSHSSSSESSHQSQTQSAPLERAQPTTFNKFVASEENSGDRRVFVYTADSEAKAVEAALGYYMMTDDGLLQKEIIKKGKKKFFFFGPSKNTYKFTVEAHYKRLLLPFIIEILKLSHIKVMAKVGLKGDNLEVSFNGPDEGLLLRNRAEMLTALEQLMRLYLANKVRIPRGMKWNLKVKGANRPESSRGNSRNDRNSKRGNSRYAERDKEREEKIIAMVEEVKAQVLDKKETIALKPLDPRDRRTVHQHLHDDKVVETTSIGDGRLKKIEISLK
jgi:ATP-dependent RNA helicase RhlE